PYLHSFPTRRSSDLLSAVTAKQFGPITDYQAVVTLNDAKEETVAAAETVLTDDPLVTHSMLVYNETIEIRPANQGKQSLTLMVPDRKSTRLNSSHVS